MNDQLQYEIYLSLSEKGVQEVTAQIEQLQKAFDEGVKRAGGMSTAVDEFGRLVDITGKATNAAKANITTQGALQKAIEEKRKALTEVNKAIRSSSEVSDEDAQKKAGLTAEIKLLSRELSTVQRDTLALNDAQTQSENTYAGLVAQNKALMLQMKNLPLDDTSGKLADLQAQYNRNNNTLKTFDASLGNHQRNVGNYKEGLQSAIMGLRGMPGPIGGAVTGFMAFNNVLKMNPLGMVLNIGVQVASWLGGFTQIADRANQIFSVFGATLGFLRDRIGALLGLNEKSNFTLAEQIRITRELTRAKQELRDLEIANIAATALLRKQATEDRLAAEDENRAISERIELLRRSLESEDAILQIRLTAAEENLRIAIEQAALAKNEVEDNRRVAEAVANLANLQSEFNESRIRRVRRLQSFERELRKEQEDAARAEIQRLAESDNRYAESLRIRTEELGAGEALDLDLAAEERRAAMIRQVFQQNEALRTQATINEARRRGDEVTAIEIEQERAWQQMRLMLINAGITDEAEQKRAFAEQEIEFERRKNDAIEKLTSERFNAQIAMAKDATSIIASLGQAFFGNNKAISIAVATIDAIGAAISAAKNATGGPIIKALAASVQLARGFALVRRMNDVRIGSGIPSVSVGGGSVSAPTESVRSTAESLTGVSAVNIKAPEIVIKADRDGLTSFINDGQNDQNLRSVTVRNDI
jgi:hypothetical protein